MTEEIYKLFAESFRGKVHLRQTQEDAQALVTAALVRHGEPRQRTQNSSEASTMSPGLSPYR